jgi:hypothetical protein
MSDFKKLNSHRFSSGVFRSTPEDGFNGAFLICLNGQDVKIIASDALGWQHVSVSVRSGNPPSWAIMCQVKCLFFEPEDCVVQFHPPESTYVNNHPGCLHLWRCTDGREFPLPPQEMVGIKSAGVIQNREQALKLFIEGNKCPPLE